MTFRYRYGIETDRLLSEDKGEINRTLEAIGFRAEIPPPVGLGKYRHLQKFLDYTWPELEWNPWLDRTLAGFCNTTHVSVIGKPGKQSRFRFIGLTGCAAAGKTFSTGVYAAAWWLADPANSIAILTSTTKDAIRDRVWPVIQQMHQTAKCPFSKKHLPFGHMLESQTTLQFNRHDSKHAIFALAVAHGETQKALQNLKGRHGARMLVVIDEANATPDAIFQAMANFRKGCADFTLIALGNPESRIDNHGRCIEPKGGYSSISNQDDSWTTKGVPEWHIDSGLCLRYDGAKSPNVVKGETIYPYLYSWEDWERAQDPKRQKTLSYWVQDRGLHPPEGFCSTVLTETQLVEHNKPDEPFVFQSWSTPIAFLDPAFGGDRCVLQFALLGDISHRKLGLQLGDAIDIPIDVETKEQVDYQIARIVIEECKRRNVQPEYFGCDATGTGRGVMAIIAGEWSPKIHRTEWGSKATDRPAHTLDGRPAHEVYHSFVAEMWFAVQEVLLAEQLRGINQQACIEFCRREYEIKARKYKIETKPEVKLKLNASPDWSDAVAGVVEIARRHGLEFRGKVVEQVEKADAKRIKEAEEELAYAVDGAGDGGWGMNED